MADFESFQAEVKPLSGKTDGYALGAAQVKASKPRFLEVSGQVELNSGMLGNTDNLSAEKQLSQFA